jgi:chemotaxis protein CheY-P-specific phosphatase CheC
MSDQTIFKNELQKAAVLAAQKASKALQYLIVPDTRLIVSDVEVLDNLEELSAKKLAERCIAYYKEGKIIIASPIKIYKDNGVKEDGGVMLMFIDQGDIDKLGALILEKITNDEERMKSGMLESAVTEALNIIGNAYIEIVSKYYKTTIMSMVPEIIDPMTFDGFVGGMLAKSNKKTYVIFNTTLMVTKNTIELPFMLAITLWKDGE